MMNEFKNFIVDYLEWLPVEIKMIRKSKRFDAYYIYRDNGQTALVYLSDFLENPSIIKKEIRREFNLGQPRIVRII